MSSRMSFVSVSGAGALLASLTLTIGCSNQQAAPVGQPKDSGSASSLAGRDGHDEDHSDHAEHAIGAADAALMVSTRPRPPRAGEPAALNLMIHASDGAMVKDFEIIHEKPVHLIVVREGLDSFAHLHPEVDARGNMKIEHTFPAGGTYRLFADYKPAGGDQAIATAAVEVEGPGSNASPLVTTAPGIIEGDEFVANVDVNRSPAGSNEVSFQLQDEKGKPLNGVEPYLGAMGHLVVISADGQQYVHAHPLDFKDSDATVRFNVHFPGKGKFKGWGQFQVVGKVHTLPFVVEIE